MAEGKPTSSSSTKIQRELQRSKSGLRVVTKHDADMSPFLMDEPHWTPDKEVPMCCKCGKTFDFLNRRHHCRRCGKIFCDKDCRSKLPLPRLSFVDPVRLCDPCFVTTKKENEFFDRHLKLLTAGACFEVSKPSAEPESGRLECNVKVTPSHRLLELRADQSPADIIDIATIRNVLILTNDTNTGGSQPSGMTLKYMDSADAEQTVTLRVKSDSSKKAATAWIVAMQKGMKMIFETKGN